MSLVFERQLNLCKSTACFERGNSMFSSMSILMEEEPSDIPLLVMVLAWCSGSVLDCHATARVLFPVGTV